MAACPNTAPQGALGKRIIAMLVSALPDAASLQASASSRSAGDSWERSPEMEMEERLVEREIQDHHPERTQLTAEPAAAVLSVLTDGVRSGPRNIVSNANYRQGVRFRSGRRWPVRRRPVAGGASRRRRRR